MGVPSHVAEGSGHEQRTSSHLHDGRPGVVHVIPHERLDREEEGQARDRQPTARPRQGGECNGGPEEIQGIA